MTQLATRRLGRTDMEITRVGFGSLAAGGADWVSGRGRQDDETSIQTIRAAVEAGINWIDTAPIYGLGHAERVVSQALAPFSENDRPFIFTKGGLQWDEADPKGAPRKIGSPASLRREVEDSLRRLRVERIDLYQMHWPPADGTAVEDYWQVFVDLRREGKVRAVGLSNHDVPQLERAEAVGHVDSLQPPFSALNRQAGQDVIPWCEANGTGVIGYAPMESGLLSGGFSPGRELAPEDWRYGHPDFTGEGLARNLQVAEALRLVAARHQIATSAAAVAWTLAWPGVTGAIVGAKNPQQLDSWLHAGDVELQDEDLELVARSIRDSGAGTGPARPATARTAAV